jgi:phosphoribosylanthranilate isomerase
VLVPASPRVVSPEHAASLARSISIPLVVVTADLAPDEAARSAATSRARVIQLHGGESPQDLRYLRQLGEWDLWKAVRVRSGDDIAIAVEQFASEVDLLLLEGWHPDGLGGMGARFPWEALAAVRDDLMGAVPVGVGGGLTAENVEEAVLRLRPDLVDVSSGVEVRPGIKDLDDVRAFVRNAKRANFT